MRMINPIMKEMAVKKRFVVWLLAGTASAAVLSNENLRVTVDDQSGTILSIRNRMME